MLPPLGGFMCVTVLTMCLQVLLNVLYLRVYLSGPPSPLPSSPSEDDSKEKSDAMPNISDIMLRKLKLHRGLPGWYARTPSVKS